MKKSLLAVAAMTAFAGAAQAQSSVTVYGILDVGYVGGHTRATTNGTVTNTVYNGFSGLGAEQTSRLGFKGVEDLGNGASAFFTVEMNLAPEDAIGFYGNRQTFAGVQKKGIGAGSFGLQYTPAFNVSALTDPGQHNGVIGNVVYVANNNAKSNNIANGTANPDANATGSFTNTMGNSLFLKSDTFAGFQAQAMYSMNNKTSNTLLASPTTATTNGGGNDITLWAIGATYNWQKLNVAAAYQSGNTQSFTTTVTPSASAAITPTLAGVASEVNVRDNQLIIGATYDFGILKAYGQYVNRQMSNNTNHNQFLKRQAYQIGVRSYITPTVETWASYGMGRYQSWGASQPTVNFTGVQLGANYYLSKRTNLYGIFGSVGANSSSVNAYGQGSTGNQYAVGVRHTF